MVIVCVPQGRDVTESGLIIADPNLDIFDYFHQGKAVIRKVLLEVAVHTDEMVHPARYL